MPRKSHTEEQIVAVLRQVEAGARVDDICRKVGISQATYYLWKRKYTGVGVSGGTTTFKYDPFGRRIQKTGPLGTTNYLYDGVNVWETEDKNESILARYTDTLSLDEWLAELVSGTTDYYGQDGLGSVTSLSNSSGSLVDTYVYDSFGKLTVSSGGGNNPSQYTSREFDSETGIYDYRARYYNPSTGRFIGEDPVRFGADVNFYEYVKNNPADFKDGYGLHEECTLVAQHQLTPWIPTANIISTTSWAFKDFAEIDDKGLAVIRCRWERSETEDNWGHALLALEYHCVDKNPCDGLTREHSYYNFEWRKRFEGSTHKIDWTGTSYTMFPMDNGDLFYEILCRKHPPLE